MVVELSEDLELFPTQVGMIPNGVPTSARDW